MSAVANSLTSTSSTSSSPSNGGLSFPFLMLNILSFLFRAVLSAGAGWALVLGLMFLSSTLSAQSSRTYVADLGDEYHTLSLNESVTCPNCTNWQFSIYSRATEQLMVWNGGGAMSIEHTDYSPATGTSGYNLYDNKGKLFMHISKLTHRILQYTDGKDTVTVNLYE